MHFNVSETVEAFQVEGKLNPHHSEITKTKISQSMPVGLIQAILCFLLALMSQQLAMCISWMDPPQLCLVSGRPHFDFCFHNGSLSRSGHTSDLKTGSLLQWPPCQAPGVTRSALGLVSPVSVHCDWMRQFDM